MENPPPTKIFWFQQNLQSSFNQAQFKEGDDFTELFIYLYGKISSFKSLRRLSNIFFLIKFEWFIFQPRFEKFDLIEEIFSPKN